MGCWVGVVVCRIARVSAATSSEEVSDAVCRRFRKGLREGSESEVSFEWGEVKHTVSYDFGVLQENEMPLRC